MYLSQQVPAVTAERTMNLGPLIATRQACSPRPHWTVLIAKAYGLLSAEYPVLRQSYMRFPWPRLYQHPGSICSLNIEREVGDERVVLYCLLDQPEGRPLAELEKTVRDHRHAPVTSLATYRRAFRVSRIPWPLRRWFLWAALNILGPARCSNFGTFCVTSVAEQGAGLLRLIPLLTSTLHYGLFDADGRMEMRLSWDHRVMDGAQAARILVRLEQTLNEDLVDEIRAQQARSSEEGNQASHI
jgi:hypothetical protein